MSRCDEQALFRLGEVGDEPDGQARYSERVAAVRRDLGGTVELVYTCFTPK